MARPRKEAQAEAVQQPQEESQVIEQAQAEAVQLVKMVRHPDFIGRSNTADVHPLEVDNMLAHGWLIKE